MRKWQTFLKVCALFLVVGFSPSYQVKAEALSYDETIDSFEFGSSCMDLYNISHDRLIEVVDAGNSEFFTNFCRLEMDQNCVVFSEIVQEFGSILESVQSEYCMFVPYPIYEDGGLFPDDLG